MSEAYEAVVFSASETATHALWNSLVTPWPVSLMCLPSNSWGLCRFASHSDQFDVAGVETVATQVSRAVGCAAALWYDDATAFRRAAIFQGGVVEACFGEPDELWVPLGSDGEPLLDAPRVRMAELDPAAEYECVTSAIDLGLNSLNMEFSEGSLKQAFCYGEARIMAWERSP